MLDVRRMRVLREVAVRGSFSAAAEALSFTQSAISQQIAALEREAGCTLVQRNARGIRLTEAGEALVRHADAILARLSEAEAELEAIAGLRGGRLRLAAFESAAATLMPLAIAAFRAEHPGVELSLIMAEPEDSAPLLRAARSTSRSATTRRIRGEVDGIAAPAPARDPMFVAMPADHPLARKRSLRLADLADDPWIAGDQRLRVQPADQPRVRGRRLRAADRLPDRRLHRDAGLRRRRRRRVADRRARPDERARRHRHPLARPRDPDPRGLRRDRAGRSPHARHAGDAGDPAGRGGALREPPPAAAARRLDELRSVDLARSARR